MRSLLDAGMRFWICHVRGIGCVFHPPSDRVVGGNDGNDAAAWTLLRTDEVLKTCVPEARAAPRLARSGIHGRWPKLGHARTITRSHRRVASPQPSTTFLPLWQVGPLSGTRRRSGRAGSFVR